MLDELVTVVGMDSESHFAVSGDVDEGGGASF
jgi:hypothetical protein